MGLLLRPAGAFGLEYLIQPRTAVSAKHLAQTLLPDCTPSRTHSRYYLLPARAQAAHILSAWRLDACPREPRIHLRLADRFR